MALLHQTVTSLRNIKMFFMRGNPWGCLVLAERIYKNFRISLDKRRGGIAIKTSICKSYDDLPLFLNANLVSQVLGVSPSSAYELMHEPGFPVLRVGSLMVVPKEKFAQSVDAQSGGAK